MVEPIVLFFEKLITQFSWARLLFIIVVSFMLISSAIWFESYTGHFRLNRIEKSTVLLDKLTSMSDKIRNVDNKTLTKTFDAITKDLEEYSNHESTPFNIDESVLKGIAAAIPWALFVSVYLITNGGSRRIVLSGVIFVATPFILLGAFLPTFEKQWVNYFAYPFGHFFAVFFLIILSQSRKTP